MHFSFGWAGAEQKTSYWTGRAAGTVEPPLPQLGRVGASSSVDLPASAGSTTARWLLVGGDTYRLTVGGTWTSGGTRHDAVCQRTSGGWSPSQAGPLQVGGDQLGHGGAGNGSAGYGGGPASTWTAVGGGSCSAGHTYTFTVAPTATTTLSLTLPGAGSGTAGTLRVRAVRLPG